MRQSKIFSKTRHDAPKDEVAKNAQILIRAGFIHKEMAGVYNYLPLGFRVIEKIKDIVREEMNMVGGQELALTSLQRKELWDKTNRWSDDVVDNWFKTTLKSGSEVGLAFTHEEPLTDLMKNQIRSHKDLPVFAYQFQNKFRNEERAKSGILRCREFLMKDLYSFCYDENEHNSFYEEMKGVYLKIFERVGLKENTYLTFASGGVFSKFSHEFQAVCDAGEDIIYVCEGCHVAVNKEVLSEQKVCPDCGNENLEERKSIEVGNIFTLGTRFSESVGLTFVDKGGESKLVFMGSYGIGIGRLMGTVVERFGEKDVMVWPEEVAPFRVHLIGISNDDDAVRSEIDKVYEKLSEAGVEVLYDDRDLRAGEKFGDADLIGIPHRLVVSKKTLESGTIEYENRITKEKENLTLEKVIEMFSERNLPAKKL